MFARFRNLFSKNKTESETGANESFENYVENAQTSGTKTVSCTELSKLEGLNRLKSLVESEEQQSRIQNESESSSNASNFLSDEEAELLNKSFLKHEKTANSKDEKIPNDYIQTEIEDCMENQEFIDRLNIKTKRQNCQGNEEIFLAPQGENVDSLSSSYVELSSRKNTPELSLSDNKNLEEFQTESKIKHQTEKINPSDTAFTNKPIEFNSFDKEKNKSSTDNQNVVDTDAKDTSISANLYEIETYREKYAIHSSSVEKSVNNSRENSPEVSESSKSLFQSSIKENSAPKTRDLSETNLCNNYSIVIEDLPSEVTTPSPTVGNTISTSSSHTTTLEGPAIKDVSEPSKIIINPINNNGLACHAITNKLSDIAEVAESLDAVIRDAQENVQYVEVESSPSPTHKETLRSTSSEDWHSRSTEDESFVTASEGNFTPSSLSFQTASGRTSSFISCDKNSFDASEADDSTFAFEMPELTSPLNMSFEGSEQSYLSAQQLTVQDEQKLPTKYKENADYAAANQAEDQTSTADIEELQSENVTPTPEQHYDGYQFESIPIDSETELEVTGIADAPSMEILTEHSTMPMSRTPEVSPSNSKTEMTVNLVRDSNGQNQPQNSNSTNNNNNNNIKPNAAWRRSKYYENITKQTIKGFL